MRIEKGPEKYIQVGSLTKKDGFARKYDENQKSLDLWNSGKDCVTQSGSVNTAVLLGPASFSQQDEWQGPASHVCEFSEVKERRTEQESRGAGMR